MSVTFKIHGATPKGGKSICHFCKRAEIVTGQNCEEFIKCSSVFEGRVPFRVAQCTEHQPINMPWLSEMKEIAWTIEARKKGQTGFQQEPGDSEMIVTVSPPKKKTEEDEDD